MAPDAHPVLRCSACRGAERPQAATPAVVDAVPALPAAVRRRAGSAFGPSCSATARGIGTPFDRARAPPGCGRARERRRSATARHVIGAVAVLMAWFGVVGVLEHPDLVAHRQHVAERRQRHDATDLPCTPTSRSAEPGVPASHRRPRQARVPGDAPRPPSTRRAADRSGRIGSPCRAQRDLAAARRSRLRSPAARPRAGTRSTRRVARLPPRRPAPRT